MTSVFVVDRRAFFGGDWPQGFAPLAGTEAARFLDAAAAHGRFVDRAQAEVTPAWKQWIPYAVVRCTNPADRHDAGVFAVRRLRQQSEARLHGAWSIGLGGHIEPVDGEPAADGPAFFGRALRRELHEELHFAPGHAAATTFLGLLNDDATEVGRVHAGLVYAVDLQLPLDLARQAVRVREIAKMHGVFTHLVEFATLWQNPTQFESWSQVLVRAGIAGPIGGCSHTGVGGHAG
jgi:predicted NUDIX family phosphoesterase